MTITEIIENCCKKCSFYKADFGVCMGEVMPVERAIEKNLEGRGLCDKIKEAMKGDNDEK